MYDFPWLEAYFDRSIVEARRKELELRAESDPALSDALTTHRYGLMSMELIVQEDLRQNLSRMLEEWQTTKQLQQEKRVYWFKWATLIIFLGVAGGFGTYYALNKAALSIPATDAESGIILNRVSLPAPQEVVDITVADVALAYFRRADIPTQVIEPSIDGRSQNAYNTLLSGNYSEAVQKWEYILRKTKRVPDAWKLTQGISYLADDQPADAIRTLVPLLHGTSKVDPEARWYLALAYFRKGNMIQGLALIEEISRYPDHFQHQQAVNLLDQLRGA